MPSFFDALRPRSPEPPRRRKKELESRERQPHSPRTPPSRRHNSTKSTSDAKASRETLSSRGSSESSTRSSRREKGRKVKMVVPEMQRRRSSLPETDSKASTPYPAFSKEHSRESVRSRGESRTYPYTPDATDLSGGRSRSKPASPAAAKPRTTSANVPPSPPLTATEPDLRKARSGSNIKPTPTRSDREPAKSGRNSPRFADARPLRSSHFSASQISLRQAEEGSRPPYKKRAETASPPRPKSVNHRRSPSPLKESFVPSPAAADGPRKAAAPSQKDSIITDSDATSVAPERKQPRPATTPLAKRRLSPPRPRGSTPGDPDSRKSSVRQPEPQLRRPSEVLEVTASSGQTTPVDHSFGPPPPPPPPPVINPAEVPRVDYLLQHGGLSHVIPRSFASASQPSQVQAYQQYMSPALGVNRASDVQNTFAPYTALLDDVSSVLSKNGSVAVATGYRSVARRLLERLERVFERNISSEVCSCVMCTASPASPTPAQSTDTGVSWGEILELVSGRQDLPPWPPFSLPDAANPGLGIAHLSDTPVAPMQKLDIDVPEEYREHYIRQSKKTKVAVQNWLAAQPDSPAATAPPPSDVDDETLTFAMLTYLEPAERRTFTALIRGMASVPDSRAPTPAPNAASVQEQQQTRSELMQKAGLALQRLYRLVSAPRDPEICMYLLKNPSLHSALATLAAISNQEWEILTSGRFDGFLWSGAEDAPSPGSTLAARPNPLSRTATPLSASNISRGPTPLSRGPTPFRAASAAPAQAAGPVALDEETEIAVLAEVEREIFAGMEALEDAFEALHVKAQAVREALRERSAGLSMSVLARRGEAGTTVAAAAAGGTDLRFGTPASSLLRNGMAGLGLGGDGGAGGQQDDVSVWGRDMEERSELAPDDSASNVGWRKRRSAEGRRRQGARRTERRTPAPVDEEGEEDEGGATTAESSPRRRK